MEETQNYESGIFGKAEVRFGGKNCHSCSGLQAPKGNVWIDGHEPEHNTPKL